VDGPQAGRDGTLWHVKLPQTRGNQAYLLGGCGSFAFHW